MLMKDSYLDDLKEDIQNATDAQLAPYGVTKERLLGDPEILDRLWYTYQKNIEEYDCDRDWSFEDALHENLNEAPRPLCTRSC